MIDPIEFLIFNEAVSLFDLSICKILRVIYHDVTDA